MTDNGHLSAPGSSGDDRLVQDAASLGAGAPRPAPGGLKGLRWEVELGRRPYYYKGRGNSPEAAMRDLREHLALGVKDATEQAESQTRRLTDLDGYLEALGGE